MMKHLFRNPRLILLLLPMLWGVAAAAETDEFDPANPPEPAVTYSVKVVANPAGVAYTAGTGRYAHGQSAWIYSSVADSDYRFVRWLKDGEPYTTDTNFWYTIGERADVVFTAEYEYVVFDPDSPADPGLNYQWRLFLVSDPEEACTFNYGSGTRLSGGEMVYLYAYANQGFAFDGWYDETGRRISESRGINFTMPAASTTLTTRWVFDPDSPADPVGSLSTLPGDVNGDGDLTVADVVLVCNMVLGITYNSIADMDSDGSITVTDLVILVNLILHAGK